MKSRLWLGAGFVAGLGLVLAGLFRLGDAHLIAPYRAQLEFELDSARRRGHPVALLVVGADDDGLRSKATALAQSSGQTVLGLSRQAVVVVLNDVDRSLGSGADLTRAAHKQVDLFFLDDDLDGAAAVLVRLYTSRLIASGILPALPPMAPLLYPDIEKHPITPAESALAGLGLSVLVYVAGCWLDQQSRTNNRRPLTNNHLLDSL